MGGTVVGGLGVLAWGARGRSSSLFAPTAWRGRRDRSAVALTFDDGPSESTPRVLELLARQGTPATFFQCGCAVRRLPAVAREVAAAGHEIGNHSDTHSPFYLRSPGFIFQELERAQKTIQDTAAVTPRWSRAPFGVRWFGLRSAHRRLHLREVTWTVIGRDWKAAAPEIAHRVLAAASNGVIICLHDGREARPGPDIGQTLAALRDLLPELHRRGFRFETVSNLLCPLN